MNSHLREFSVSTHIPPPAPGPTRASAAPSIADVTSGTPVDTPADIVGLRVAATIGAVCNDATVAYNMTTGKFSHVGESMEAALCLFAERVGQSSQVLESSAVCASLSLSHLVLFWCSPAFLFLWCSNPRVPYTDVPVDIRQRFLIVYDMHKIMLCVGCDDDTAVEDVRSLKPAFYMRCELP